MAAYTSASLARSLIISQAMRRKGKPWFFVVRVALAVQGDQASIRATSFRAWPSTWGKRPFVANRRRRQDTVQERAADLPVPDGETVSRSSARHGPRWLNTLFSSAERTQARPRLPCDICGSPARPTPVYPDANLERRGQPRRAFIGRVRRKRHAREVYVCITFYFRDLRGPCVAN